MNSDGLDERIRRLRASRRCYSAAVRELQEMGRKITILGRLLAESPTDIWMSTDRESVLFTEKRDGEELGISRAELDALPEKIGGTLLASREIDQLEKCLYDAGFGDLIGP